MVPVTIGRWCTLLPTATVYDLGHDELQAKVFEAQHLYTFLALFTGGHTSCDQHHETK